MSARLRIFLDSEFMEDGITIEPLSLALLTEHGACLYIVITDADRSKANEFVVEHVLPHLDIDPLVSIKSSHLTYLRIPRSEAAKAVRAWVEAELDDGQQPEFWAYYAAYDWVLFCQLFGNMTDLPKGWPMFVRDLRQHVETKPKGTRLAKVPSGLLPEHHAVADVITEMIQFNELEARS